jgi:hypothetical protein
VSRSSRGRGRVTNESPETPQGPPEEPKVRSGALPRTMPKEPENDEAPKKGYRSSRRTSIAGKRARRTEQAERTKSRVGEGVGRAANAVGRAFRTVGAVVLIILALMGGLYATAIGINALARWNAKRLAAQAGSTTERAKDNLLVIGVDNGQAIGFAALKAERANKRVLGIAIPDGAFVEVPGQGFERIGESYVQGPEVAKDAVSNYLLVPFQRYIVVDSDAYQALLKNQDVAQLISRATKTDLNQSEQTSLADFLKTVKTKDVWIVPLPVKPIAVGDEKYYEPQRAEVADLLLQWWGVRVDQQKATARVIVYNGVGTPGIAGKAAQQLIRKGFRVVDSGNADNFNYKKTQVLLYHGTEADAQAVVTAIGVGEIKVQSAPQDLTDIIVIIGADYQPPVVP